MATVQELRIELCGLNFLTLCGSHINGGYAYFPYWGFGVELSTSEFDIKYNADKIASGLLKCDSLYLPTFEDERKKWAYALSELITKAISE